MKTTIHAFIARITFVAYALSITASPHVWSREKSTSELIEKKVAGYAYVSKLYSHEGPSLFLDHYDPDHSAFSAQDWDLILQTLGDLHDWPEVKTRQINSFMVFHHSIDSLLQVSVLDAENDVFMINSEAFYWSEDDSFYEKVFEIYNRFIRMSIEEEYSSQLNPRQAKRFTQALLRAFFPQAQAHGESLDFSEAINAELEPEQSRGLSNSQKLLIGVGIAIVAALVIYAIVRHYRKRKKAKKNRKAQEAKLQAQKAKEQNNNVEPLEGCTPPPAMSAEERSKQAGPEDFSWDKVEFAHKNVSNWSETSQLSSVTRKGSDICLTHSKANTWSGRMLSDNPDTIVNANPWYIVNENGRWVASTWHWMRPGQTCKADQINGKSSGGVLPTCWRPRKGQKVGIFMSGTARGGPVNAHERSNIQWIDW